MITYLKYLTIISVLLFATLYGLDEGPYEVNCPDYPLIREANVCLINETFCVNKSNILTHKYFMTSLKNELCPEEELYLKNRKRLLQNNIRQYLTGLDRINFTPEMYDLIAKHPPRLGVAISGGGYRSMLTGSGFLKGLDEFKLIDCLSYISGLSGGSWILMDLIIHGFDIDKLLKNWDLKDGLLEGIPEFDISQKDIVSGMGKNRALMEKRLEKRMYHFKNLETNGKQFDEFYDFFENIWTPLDEEGSKIFNGTLVKRGDHPLERLKLLIFGNSTSQNSSVIYSFKKFRQVLDFYTDLHLEVRKKKIQGFYVSFTDYWGKALIKRLKHNDNNTSIIGTTNSLTKLIQNNDKFQKFEAPIPIFIANCRNGHLRNKIFEFTPFEFGSWDDMLRLFVKLPYLGSKIIKGVPEICYNDFDDIGFITATSSSIFNNVILYIWQLISESSHEVMKAIETVMGLFGISSKQLEQLDEMNSMIQPETDYAVYHYNPFYQYPGNDNDFTRDSHLYLVDGGEDGENIPLRPLLIPERDMDVIFVIDSSSDKNNFANGTKLLYIFKELEKQGIHYKVPKELKKFGKSQNHPLIIGCHAKSNNGVPLPIIIYYPNAEYSFPSNTSTFKVMYDDNETSSMLQNGKDIFTDDNNPFYKNCLGCIISKRSIDKHGDGINYSKFCNKCFKKYCAS
ncbi:putative carboxylic ester hydrolase NDAI_0G00820 [Naumovozyma dairenensis CBS 421]|uniref:Lysophospholipase n=1 Tax=Naumovozyma dairenensis (strain ATCC 10597 / BCRC 20456 / CBS 421 / NBRC 0211 / NRRL Y-12639) TaxID=1071378 RepID=G0WDJ7_NAUDC|nr:hypothetical protein NDAI_0G00820 [Naumovozyma dairenensis CBS 421]CCD25858.2 hypothetical protein NDAI_0G00820 [Naumovozyma dairenensis CBS 421]